MGQSLSAPAVENLKGARHKLCSPPHSEAFAKGPTCIYYFPALNYTSSIPFHSHKGWLQLQLFWQDQTLPGFRNWNKLGWVWLWQLLQQAAELSFLLHMQVKRRD